MGMSIVFELLKTEHKNLYFNADSKLKTVSGCLLEFWVAWYNEVQAVGS